MLASDREKLAVVLVAKLSPSTAVHTSSQLLVTRRASKIRLVLRKLPYTPPRGSRMAVQANTQIHGCSCRSGWFQAVSPSRSTNKPATRSGSTIR